MNSQQIRLLAWTACCAAGLCILAPLSIPLPWTPIPFSLSTFVILLFSPLIGIKCSVTAVAVYRLIGGVGLPVFSGFSGGFSILTGPTGGYLIGYLCLAAFAASHLFSSLPVVPALFLRFFLGSVVCIVLGTCWLAFVTQSGLWAAVLQGVIPFLPGDGLKIVAASLLSPLLSGRLSKIVPL